MKKLNQVEKLLVQAVDILNDIQTESESPEWTNDACNYTACIDNEIQWVDDCCDDLRIRIWENEGAFGPPEVYDFWYVQRFDDGSEL